MIIDEPGDLVPIITIGATILGVILWIINAEIRKMAKQFQPNGGSSLKDQLTRIERDNLYLRDRLDTHIDQHQKEGK